MILISFFKIFYFIYNLKNWFVCCTVFFDLNWGNECHLKYIYIYKRWEKKVTPALSLNAGKLEDDLILMAECVGCIKSLDWIRWIMAKLSPGIGSCHLIVISGPKKFA